MCLPELASAVFISSYSLAACDSRQADTLSVVFRCAVKPRSSVNRGDAGATGAFARTTVTCGWDTVKTSSTRPAAGLEELGLKSDYRYSIGLVYNTFPLPPGFADAGHLGAGAARAGRARRSRRPRERALADLYDPDLMPPNLRRAHHALDRAVDRLYRWKRFTSERERVE